MELNTPDIVFPVPHGHDLSVAVPRRYLKYIGKVLFLDNPGVVPACLKFSRNTPKKIIILHCLLNITGDTMVYTVQVPDGSSVYLGDGLVSEANPQDAFQRSEPLNNFLGMTGFIRYTGTRRYEYLLESASLFRMQFIVPFHGDLHPADPLEVLDQVIGERVVIIDYQYIHFDQYLKVPGHADS